HLRLEPAAVFLNQISRIGCAQGGQEEGQRIDAVFEDVDGSIEEMDGGGDVAAALGEDANRPVERGVKPALVGLGKARKRGRGEAQIACPEDPEMARARG